MRTISQLHIKEQLNNPAIDLTGRAVAPVEILNPKYLNPREPNPVVDKVVSIETARR